MVSENTFDKVPLVGLGWPFGQAARAAFSAQPVLQAAASNSSLSSMSVVEFFRPLTRKRELALTLPSVAGPAAGAAAVVVRASDVEAFRERINYRTVSQFIVADYGRDESGVAAARALLDARVEAVVFPLALWTGSDAPQPFYVQLSADAPEAEALGVTAEDAAAYVALHAAVGVGRAFFLMRASAVGGSRLIAVGVSRLLELTGLTLVRLLSEAVFLGVGLAAGDGRYLPIPLGWVGELVSPRARGRESVVVYLRPTLAEAMDAPPSGHVPETFSGVLQLAVTTPAVGSRGGTGGAGGAAARGGASAGEPRVRRGGAPGRGVEVLEVASRLSGDSLGDERGVGWLLSPERLSELERAVEYALKFLDADGLPSVAGWADVVERAAEIRLGKARAAAFFPSGAPCGRFLPSLVTAGAAAAGWDGGRALACGLNALTELCAALPDACFVVKAAPDEAEAWAPRGPAVKEWLNGCLMAGYVVVAACPAYGGQAPFRAPGIVVGLVEGEWHVLCVCHNCARLGLLAERIRTLEQHAQHLCGRAFHGDCACSKVPGHVFVVLPVELGTPSVSGDEGSEEEGETNGVSASSRGSAEEGAGGGAGEAASEGAIEVSDETVEVVELGGTIGIRPLWRWARMEQVWCARFRVAPTFDWDKLRVDPPAKLKPEVDGQAPPSGWVGNGYPGPTEVQAS